jgi:Domain of unknown function (DUF4124)
MTLAASSVLLAGNVLAGEIYKYTDEDGTVSYVDRPTTDPDREQMAIRSRPTDNAAIQANTQARVAAANAAAVEQATQKEAAGTEKLTRGERRAAAAEKQQQCDMYRAQLDTIAAARRLVREDENGERIYLDEDETQAAKDQVRERIQQNCS